MPDRDARGRFPKGISGNPGGRPARNAELAERIVALTNDGGDMVELHIRVMNDPEEKTETRLQAAAWLADRGFGKPMQTAKVEATVRPPLAAMDLVGDLFEGEAADPVDDD